MIASAQTSDTTPWSARRSEGDAPAPYTLIAYQTLLDRVGGSEELLVEIIDLFNEDAAELIDQIRLDLSAGNGAGAQGAAHALKGSMGNFGAAPLLRLTHQIEVDAAAGRLDAARRTLPDLESLLDMLSVELNELRASLTASCSRWGQEPGR